MLANTQADIDRAQFRITTITRSATLQTTEAEDDSAEISSLSDQITPLEIRIAGMAVGEARTKEEIRLRALRRDREKLQDEQLGGQGSRAAFRRKRELDATQRTLAGYQDCPDQCADPPRQPAGLHPQTYHQAPPGHSWPGGLSMVILR